MIDLRPATSRMADLVHAIEDDELARPTPCPDHTVGDLVDHVGTFARVFDAVARKDLQRAARPGPPDADNLETGWRDRIAADLAVLADAWDDPAAWTGTTSAGGIELTGADAGLVALDELVVHGWDLSVATGRAYVPAPAEVEAATAWVTAFDPPRDGSLFGPIVPDVDQADAFEHLLGLTGRDPRWQPPG
jgi:uncharacterized protein (TIGR03086 family)